MAHCNALQSTLTSFSITKEFRHSEQKRTSEQGHVTNASSPLVLYNNKFMVRLISRQRRDLAAFKLTKLFGINDFPAAKDPGKVLIIIIYCYWIIIIIIIIIFINIIVVVIIIIIIIVVAVVVVIFFLL